MDIQVIVLQMIQLFLVIALGYLLLKIKIFDVDFNQRLTTLLLSVTTPALIVSSVLSITIEKDLSEIIFVFIVAIVIFMVLPILGLIIVKIMKVPLHQQGLYIFMTMFSNIGFMGFPVMKSIFGNEAVFLTAIFNMLFNLLVFTVGILFMNYRSAEKISINLRQLFSPGVVSSLVALLIYLTGFQMPDIISSTITMIGDITTPIAMMLIGSTLATIPLKEVFNELRVYPYTILKQIIIPIIAYPILNFFIKDALILGVSLIMISMPVGNIAVLFATEYHKDVALAAKTVFMTTLLSIITIPLIVALFLTS